MLLERLTLRSSIEEETASWAAQKPWDPAQTTDVLDKTIQTYSNVAIFLPPNFFRTPLCWPLSDGFCFLVSMHVSPILTHSLVG